MMNTFEERVSQLYPHIKKQYTHDQWRLFVTNKLHEVMYLCDTNLVPKQSPKKAKTKKSTGRFTIKSPTKSPKTPPRSPKPKQSRFTVTRVT